MPNNLIICCLIFGLQFLISCSTQKETTTLLQTEPLQKKMSSGVEVHLIRILQSNSTATDVFNQFGESVTSPETTNKLERDGLLVWKVDASQMPAIKNLLGEVTYENKISHGYIHTWRDIHQQEVAKEGTIISKDGVPHYIQSGLLSLLARCWQVHREDGVFVYLQVVPTWHVPRTTNNLIAQSRKPTQSAVFEDLEIEVLLQDSQCLLIASESTPHVVSTGPIDEGKPPMRLGEALMGGSVLTPTVTIVLIESQLVDI